MADSEKKIQELVKIVSMEVGKLGPSDKLPWHFLHSIYEESAATYL